MKSSCRTTALMIGRKTAPLARLLPSALLQNPNRTLCGNANQKDAEMVELVTPQSWRRGRPPKLGERDNQSREGDMRFQEGDFDIPQVCLDTTSRSLSMRLSLNLTERQRRYQ